MIDPLLGNQGSLVLQIEPFQEPVRISWNLSENDFSIQIAPVSEAVAPYLSISVEAGETKSTVFWPAWPDFIGFQNESAHEIDPIALIRRLIAGAA